MTVVALLGRKGGSGKSTLSTNIAAWCARNGHHVMLGDVDRQQSVRSWLQRRSPQAAKISTWAVDNGKVFRAPPGTTHVVLDTPGGLYDHDLAKLVVWIDAVIVPIGPSVFDRDASLDFLKELNKLPKVASGRCQVAAVGMRWPPERVQQWHENGQQWDTKLLTVIPDSSVYRSCLENGGSLFDLPTTIQQSEMPHWQPVLNWLESVWKPASPDTQRTANTPVNLVTKAQLMGTRETHPIVPQPLSPVSRWQPLSNRTSTPLSQPVVRAVDVVPAATGTPPDPNKGWVPKWLRIA